jgi:hypothetical protein
VKNIPLRNVSLNLQKAVPGWHRFSRAGENYLVEKKPRCRAFPVQEWAQALTGELA